MQHMAFKHNMLEMKIRGLKLDVNDYQPLAYNHVSDQRNRLKWHCLKCNSKFAKEYALMLHLAHFHYFELLIPMNCKRIEFAEKWRYSCTQKNCEATFRTSKVPFIYYVSKNLAFFVHFDNLLPHHVNINRFSKY